DSGIGQATAELFAREGADVAITYNTDAEGARETARRVEALGRRCLVIQDDVGDPASVAATFDRVASELGILDILVNNAGKQQSVEDFLDISDEQFDETFKTNVYAMFWMTKAAVPHLAPGSAIISTSSIQAYQPSPTLVDY
uniref:SDR family oxidoreductase n=1 Tax=Enterococcus faecalis TaxID=1351 RepID=UPI001177C4EE